MDGHHCRIDRDDFYNRKTGELIEGKKTFTQWRIEIESGEKVWNAGTAKWKPYQSDKLHEELDIVLVVEGEKCADSANENIKLSGLNWLAVTSRQGAGAV